MCPGLEEPRFHLGSVHSATQTELELQRAAASPIQDDDDDDEEFTMRLQAAISAPVPFKSHSVQQAAASPIQDDDDDDLDSDQCLAAPIAVHIGTSGHCTIAGSLVDRPETPCLHRSHMSGFTNLYGIGQRYRCALCKEEACDVHTQAELLCRIHSKIGRLFADDSHVREVTVVRVSGQVVFGPQELAWNITIGGLKSLFESGRPKSLALESRHLDDSQSLADLPAQALLTVAYAQALTFNADGECEVEQSLAESYNVWELSRRELFGDVYKAALIGREPLEFVTIKKIEMEVDGFDLQPGEVQGIPSSAIREVAALRNCSHPNVIRLQEVLHGSHSMYLTMEHMEMDMRAYGKAFGALTNQDQLKSVAHMCFEAMRHCHSLGIMHRNINPSAILVDVKTMQVKLSDFGSSRTFTQKIQSVSNDVITLWYRPPEILLGECNYGPSVDTWSMATALVEIAAGAPLFNGDSEIATIFMIFKFLGTPVDTLWPGVSSLPLFKRNFPKWPAGNTEAKIVAMAPALEGSGAELLTSCLQYDSVQRLSGRQCVRHEFFDGLRQAK